MILPMANQKDRILVVDSDIEAAKHLAEETLQPAGFQVATAADGPVGLQGVEDFRPDLIVVSLTLGEFSGKDMLAALRTQGFEGPIIALVEREEEAVALQVFRLGATDYLAKPFREAEAIAVIDRAMLNVHAERERDQLQGQLQQANQALEQRVRELTTLFGIGKAVTNLSDVDALFGQLVEAAIYVTNGELGWMLLADEAATKLVLRAARNLPDKIMQKLRMPWHGGLAPLVMMSGEALIISGQSLENFEISEFAGAAVVSPIKVRQRMVGVLVTARESTRAFAERDQAMASAVADYASVALVNLRLFQALEARARSLQQAYDDLAASEVVKTDFLQNMSHELRTPLSQAQWQLNEVISGGAGDLTKKQIKALQNADSKLERTAKIIENIVSMAGDGWTGIDPEQFLLVDVAREAMAAHQNQAQRREIALIAGFPDRPLHVVADRTGIHKVFDQLIANAIKFGNNGDEVNVRISDGSNGKIQVEVKDTGAGIPADQLERIFDRFVQLDGSTTRRYGGTGLGLALTKEIIEAHGGNIWAASEPGQGATFTFTLLKSDPK